MLQAIIPLYILAVLACVVINWMNNGRAQAMDYSAYDEPIILGRNSWGGSDSADNAGMYILGRT